MNTKAMHHLTYGVYLLSARDGDRDNACIINTAVQVATNPTRVSIAVIRGGLTHDMIKRTGLCTLSAITEEADFSLFSHFGMKSGRDTDKFRDFSDVARDKSGLLYLTAHASAYMTLKVTESHDLGSHTLFIGEVIDGELIAPGRDCTYTYYQTVIKAMAPKPAATHGFRCTVCGYVYEGDALPEGYLCPLCKHGAEDFMKICEEDASPAPAAPAAEGGYVCSICGYVHKGDTPPESCPLCHAAADKFTATKEGGMTWAAEHIVGIGKKDASDEIVEGLRANFQGECTEVGMYLAMARVAHREGLPGIGEYWEKAAREEAEHAAKFAELLGEVVTDSTQKNLEMRVAAENGATEGKTRLAEMAKALGLDAIHDTVHEMARDEARHGKALAGLLAKYFSK